MAKRRWSRALWPAAICARAPQWCRTQFRPANCPAGIRTVGNVPRSARVPASSKDTADSAPSSSTVSSVMHAEKFESWTQTIPSLV